jgi:glycogen debranching enzyme
MPQRTGDDAFDRDPMASRCSVRHHWIEHFGDSDGDGLIDYARGQDSGLSNQGWKDSEDSVFHADGRFPDGPIAVVEVQGYAFAAFAAWRTWPSGAARSSRRIVGAQKAETCGKGRDLFWMEERGFYAMASTATASPVASSRLQPRPPALLRPSLARARPQGDRYLAVLGLPQWLGRADPGHGRSALQSDQLPQRLGLAARHGLLRHGPGPLWRARRGGGDVRPVRDRGPLRDALPELFCGFPGGRRTARGLSRACLPQAWAAGSAFMMLQACLGLTVDGWRGEINISNPRLPIGIDRLGVHGLRVSDKIADIDFERAGQNVYAHSGRNCTAPILIRR